MIVDGRDEGERTSGEQGKKVALSTLLTWLLSDSTREVDGEPEGRMKDREPEGTIR
jgi:hypothetical protein